MQDTRRKRIVINLDEKSTGSRRAGTRKKSGWRRVLGTLFLLIIVGGVLAAAGGFFWWRHYKTTPAYSIALMIDAAQRNDQATVGQLMDVPKIISSLTSQVTEKATARYGVTLDTSTKQQIENTISSMGPTLQQTIQQELSKEITELAQGSERRSFYVTALTVPYVVKITTQGALAQASFSKNDRTTNLTLAQNGERWQVVGMQDDAVIQRLVDKLMLNLPTIGLAPGAGATGRPPGANPSGGSRRRRR
jgi:hypothetical protein